MPETLAAPAAPAAAAPVASPTPAAAPASTPEPAAPAAAPATTTETPTAAPASTETTGAAPATTTEAAPAAAATGTAEPQRGDYADSPEGIQKFLNDHYAWEAEQDGQPDLVTGDEIPVEGEEAAEAEEKPAEEPAKADETPKPAEPEVSTPEALSKLIEGKPELKSLIDADPEVKGALFQMARVNAKAAPILEVFPNVESAKFAQQSANEFVGLKTAFQLSDTPEKIADAAQMFLEQFKVVDDKGQPVLDAAGQPTYGDDLTLFVDHIKGRDRQTRIADLKTRLEANKYATADGKENDEHLLDAYEFIAAAESANPEDLDKPDTANMSPEMKAYFDKKESELNAEREKLGLKDKELTTKTRTEARQRYDTQYRQEFGGATGKYLSNYLQQKEAAGVAIPHYLLTMADPKTGVPVFAQQAFARLNAAIEADPMVKTTAARLEMHGINDQGLAARVKYGQEQIDALLPGIVDKMLHEAGVSIAADAKKAVEAREAKRTDARVEPSTSGRSNPQKMSDEQLMAKAKQNVAAKLAGNYVDPAKRMEMELLEKNRLESE